MAKASDIMVPGYKNDHVINMRLWSAFASRELDLSDFSKGDYIGAVESQVSSETISKVLYPPDHNVMEHSCCIKSCLSWHNKADQQRHKALSIE